MIIRSILVALDLTESSQHILEFARMVAAASNSSLHLLHVIASPVATPGALEENRRAALRRLEGLLDRVDRDAGHATYSCETGTPAHEIVQYATDHAVDLIVMGTHSHGPGYHLPYGSAADTVLRLAPCAVLAVKSGDTTARIPVRTTIAAARGEA
ncbi:MAG TPA: universal stress protein [Vicinamibacterales bacterium]|jgi:universal stress protein A